MGLKFSLILVTPDEDEDLVSITLFPKVGFPFVPLPPLRPLDDTILPFLPLEPLPLPST